MRDLHAVEGGRDAVVAAPVFRSSMEHLRRDAALHVFIAAYAVCGLLLTAAAGVSHKFDPLGYAAMLFKLLPLAVLVLVIWACLRGLGAVSPLRAASEALFGLVMGPQALAGAAMFVSLALFFGVFTSIKTTLPDLVPFFADQLLADMDRTLHSADPWRYAVAILPQQATAVLDLLYGAVWGAALAASLLAVLLVPQLRSVRSHYLWAVLIVWVTLGNVVAVAAMSAGPVFYAQVAGSERFSELLALLDQHSLTHQWTRAYLWRAYSGGYVEPAAGISAFPSVHVATATLLVLLASTLRAQRWAIGLAVAYCATILFGSVYLGWHYAVDGYFSIAATTLIWIAVGRATNKASELAAARGRSRRRPSIG